MMVLNQDQIDELVTFRSPGCVSLFLPTHRTGREQRQDTIRLKNLLTKAREKLVAEGRSPNDIESILAAAESLRSDEIFWRYCSDGLACFCAPDFFRAYRVPLPLDEQMFVKDRFYIRPLLPLLRSDARLYVLALTQESARLFESTKYSIREINLPDIKPLEVDGTEQSLQYHAHQSPSQGKGETDSAMFHGHGGPSDRAKKDTLRYFQMVNRVVAHELRGQRSPLVLACVGYLAPLYESANSYGNLIRGKIPGNPSRWSDDELREHAWKLVEPDLQRHEEQAWQEFQEASSNGRGSDKLDNIVLAADQGRIDTLFLAKNEERWGNVDAQLQAVHPTGDESDGEELLDYAAARTISNGGTVYLLDTLPEIDSPVAATFRY